MCLGGGEGYTHAMQVFFYTQVHRKEEDVANSVGFKDSSKQTFKNSKKLVWEVEYVAFCSFRR